MERNSAGQVIVKENGSLLLSIPCITSTISIKIYDRFLLDEREFTELVPTIDKDALINKLENDVAVANKTINVLSANLTQEKINSIGGCNVGIRISSSAAPTQGTGLSYKTYNGIQYQEKIGFDILSSADGVYYNAIQTNDKPTYDVTNKGATLYQDANSKAFYTLKATIKYRYRYVGLNTITKSMGVTIVDNTLIYPTQTWIKFYKAYGNTSEGIGDGVSRLDDIAGVYKTNDITKEFTMTLSQNNVGLGGATDFIYLPVLSMADDFIMEILPGSTFTILPE
jgi:hypothetical protein